MSFNVVQRTLYDIRDNNSYTVRKLADGNCWMTENLRLEFDGSTTYDSTTTNLAAGTTITPKATQIMSIGTNFTADDTRLTAQDKLNIRAWTTDPVSHMTINQDDPVTTKIAQASGKVDGFRNIFNQWLSRSTNGVREDDVPDFPNDQKTGENQKIGTYYNWHTATAGTGEGLISEGDVAPASICPRGWQLPRATGNGSWSLLVKDVYNIIVNDGNQAVVPDGNLEANTIFHKKPFSVPYSGETYYYTGLTIRQGTNGGFYNANVYAKDTQYHASDMYFNGTHFNSLSGSIRSAGMTIRCIAQ